MSEYIRNQILGIADNFKALASMAGDIEQVARICTDTLKAGNKICLLYTSDAADEL